MWSPFSLPQQAHWWPGIVAQDRRGRTEKTESARKTLSPLWLLLLGNIWRLSYYSTCQHSWGSPAWSISCTSASPPAPSPASRRQTSGPRWGPAGEYYCVQTGVPITPVLSSPVALILWKWGTENSSSTFPWSASFAWSFPSFTLEMSKISFYQHRVL